VVATNDAAKAKSNVLPPTSASFVSPFGIIL